ncbi:MAG: hypothetical protein ACE366_17530 [Bradymonadia bacterium]
MRLPRLLTTLVALSTLACGAAAEDNPTQDHHPTRSSAMTQTITFQPGKVYEVTGIWVKPGKGQDLANYFNKVFPIAAKDYGVKPLFGLEPVNVYSGDFQPHVFFVNEWPSLDHFKRFVDDPRAKALFPERDAVTERLVVTQYQVPEAREVTLKDGDVIEFAAMWVKPGKESQLGAYYKKAFGIAMQNGIKPMTPLKAVFSYSGDFNPTNAGLNLWGTLDNFKAFERAAASHFPQRDDALSRLEVTQAKVRFQSAEGQ